MLQKLEYTYEIDYCTYLEKPCSEITLNEFLCECAHPGTDCNKCPNMKPITKQGCLKFDPNELAF